MSDAPELPFVSVIVPVYNDVDRIGHCLDALAAQTYPPSRYEIIVVDNGSTDGTPEMLHRSGVHALNERTVQSSYAARNVGLRAALGTVLAFTDSDCRPLPDWISCGVRALVEQEADLAGGAIRFVRSTSPNGAELYDSITNMQIARSIGERRVTKTANLFVTSNVVQAIGSFPSVRSGGDVLWTRRATDAGFRLVYAPAAEVKHPTRRLLELLGKQHRVGRGQPGIWASSGWSLAGRLRAMSRTLLPDLTPRMIRRQLQAAEICVSTMVLWRIWATGWMCRLSTLSGNLRALPQLWRSEVQKQRSSE